MITKVKNEEKQRSTYNVEETAYQLGFGMAKTYRLIRAGKIPAVRLEGQWRIPIQRFNEWLNQESK